VLTYLRVLFFYLQGHEPFVSYEGLGQLHRFLFILGITHVLYSFVTVVLSMIKVSVPSPFAYRTFFLFSLSRGALAQQLSCFLGTMKS
jgi:hypothetical protein